MYLDGQHAVLQRSQVPVGVTSKHECAADAPRGARPDPEDPDSIVDVYSAGGVAVPPRLLVAPALEAEEGTRLDERVERNAIGDGGVCCAFVHVPEEMSRE